ncbi:hypothetical protein CPB85DRAFT_285234 [Mucidula mucida]|nr:hypothetical protein CPB85DRAFT_285234 [Mucidula mucida]
MVLTILEAAFNSPYFPSSHVRHLVLGFAGVLAIRAFSQGRTTGRDRDLHARVILMTGAFSPLGLTTMQSLAQRGAHIIALTDGDVESPESEATILVDLLRSTTSNQEIYAEHCDLKSPSAIQEFCTKFMSGDNSRIDALLLMHEYKHIGPFSFLSTNNVDLELERQTNSLSTFHLITTLLPGLLLAPVERDIRIINVVNRFYAAAATTRLSVSFSSFSSDNSASPSASSIFLSEGTRSLKTTILTRHIQRVLDALPAAQIPKTENTSTSIPVASSNAQKSNIVAVTVSPGISRVDTIAPLLNADWTSSYGWSWLGVLIYIFAQPLLRLFIKTPASAMQTVLHALFLPTPFKVISKEKPPPGEGETGSLIDKSVLGMPEEVLKPGALYAECAVVKLSVPPVSLPPRDDKGKGKEEEETLELVDDGELGGEATGRAVWEAYEAAVKVWQEREPKKPKNGNKKTEGSSGVSAVPS